MSFVMRGLRLVCLGALLLASSSAGTPLQAGMERREETSTETSVVWTFTTVTAPPVTTTVNPNDVTKYVTLGTITEYAYTVSAVSTSSCVTYSYLDPKPTGPVVTVTVTNTITITSRATVTAIDSLSPPKTVWGTTASIVTTSAGLTVWSTSCTNTLVESMYVASTSTYTALPSVTAYTRATVTSVCMISSLVSLFVAGPTPTVEPYVPGISRFSQGGPTLLTIKQPTSTVVTVSVPDRTSTFTETVCNNPSTAETSVWYVVTVTPAPTTSYVSGKDCGGGHNKGALETAGAAAAVGGSSDSANAKKRRDDAIAVARGREEDSNRLGARGSVVSAATVTFTTIGLVDNTVVTKPATAVYEFEVQTFTTVYYEPVTVTASQDVKYVTLCSASAVATAL